MTRLERNAERDAAILAILPHVAEHGWTTQALRHGLAASGGAASAEFLFSGTLDMVEAYLDLADRRMAASSASLTPTRRSERVRALVALRLHQGTDERPALRRAFGLLALPIHADVSARALARTVDLIWHEAGDHAADFSWYTKRATLAAVYAATLLHWLRHDPWSDPDDQQTLAFLDRRLAGVARLGKLKARVAGRLGALLPAGLQENPQSQDTAPTSHPPVLG